MTDCLMNIHHVHMKLLARIVLMKKKEYFEISTLLNGYISHILEETMTQFCVNKHGTDDHHINSRLEVEPQMLSYAAYYSSL